MGVLGDGTEETDKIQACLDASLSVYFPPGNYKVSIPANSTRGYALVLRSGHHVFGDGYASKIYADFPPVTNPPTPPYFDVFRFIGSGTTTGNLLIENLRIEGINKALYDSSTGWTAGNGIFLIQCTNIIIRTCFFANFGDKDTNVGCAIDVEGPAQDILIDGNHITGGKGTGDASDIRLAYLSHPAGNVGPGFAIIVNNFCSCANPPSDSSANNSQGIFVNASNYTQGKIIIAGNVCWNKLRHGICPMYAGLKMQYVDTIVSNNVCFNCGWSGVYFAGGVKLPDFTPLDSGGTTSIIGNIIEYCGGGASGGLNGGIQVTDTLPPVLVSNNYVRMAGYQLNQDGSVQARTYGSPGIWANLVSGELTIDGNVVEQSQSNGIKIYQKVGSISIKNNSLLDNEQEQIAILGSAAITTAIYAELIGNKIQLANKDSYGISLNYFPNAAAAKFIIRGNSVIGRKHPASPNVGIRILSLPTTGVIALQSNLIDGWDQGIVLDSTSSPWLLPMQMYIANNVISNNTTGIIHTLTSSGHYGMIFGNLMDGNTTDLSPAGGLASGIKYAMGLSPAAGGVGNRVVFFDSVTTSAPTGTPSGGWNAGSIVFNTTPTAGGYIGWVYVGSPTNAWKQFGLIAT
jgi:hypothetical protein